MTENVWAGLTRCLGWTAFFVQEVHYKHPCKQDIFKKASGILKYARNIKN